MKTELAHDEDRRRFNLHVDGQVAFVSYHYEGDTMYLDHSEVPYHLRGQGIGKVLVEKTFEHIRSNNIKAVAVCSFIRLIKMRSEKWNKLIG